MRYVLEIQMEPIWETLQRDESLRWGVFNFRNLEGEISTIVGSPLTPQGRGSELLSSLPSQEPTVTGRKPRRLRMPDTANAASPESHGRQGIKTIYLEQERAPGEMGLKPEAWGKSKEVKSWGQKKGREEGIIKNRSYIPKTLLRSPGQWGLYSGQCMHNTISSLKTGYSFENEVKPHEIELNSSSRVQDILHLEAGKRMQVWISFFKENYEMV